MRRLNYVVPEEYDGRKVLHFLRGSAGCSYSLVRSLKTFSDGILLNGVQIRTIDRLHAGDMVSITLHDKKNESLISDIQVPILYEDEDVIIFNKPYDMACHQVKHKQQGTLANVFAAYCAKQGVSMPCRILNRLDKDTTGAVLIAKNAFAAAALTGHVDKLYLAIAHGRLDSPDGLIDAPIGQPDRTNPRRCICDDGQRAKTEYHTSAYGDNYSVVQCTLHTGRTHQIRVHLSSMGHALLGDHLYDGDCTTINRQALHCVRLIFIHPVSKKRIKIEAPLPQDMQKFTSKAVRRWQ